jgi:adenine-specific DNA-methyltransferase
MNKEQLQGLLNQKYNPENWNKIYGSIFPNVMLFASPKEIAISEQWVKSFRQRGLVRLDGNQDVAIFEVVLQDGISVQSKRVGLRNLVAKLIDEYQNHGVLAVFDNGSPEYRFTFAAKETKVTREGIEKSETDSKRYTYILGESETCKTAAEQFIKLAEKGTGISLTDLRDAFSVEKLSKQFFSEYKEQYNQFVGYLASQPRILKPVFGDDEKKMRDFVKLLLGRLVFLQFVQKKKWLGVPAKNKDWHSGDVRFLVNAFNGFANKDKFYSNYLEELFFECLNNPNRKNELFELSGTKVPFLNGGLFENDNAKTKNVNFPAPYFAGLFEFFGKYNFTIDENDPTEKEVGIDPEMLGSIFENLLEDNKDKGAFYTPKEIVHYMCQESLIEYLNTKVNEKQDERISESIRVFITNRKTDEHILKLVSPLAIALREVKICDPAIGSGAFPMGMLMEIFHAVFELFNANPKIVSKEWKMNGWQPNIVKSNIIQNSIYGVDIEKGAVDIARLRFWLSLIVDEDEPKALPNLDYKIVVGNSLVSKLGEDIIDIDWEVKANSDAAKKLQQEIQKNLNKLFNTQKLFFDFNGKKENLKAEVRNLKIDVLISQLQLDKYKYGNTSAQIGSLFEMTTKEKAIDQERKDKLTGFDKIIRELQRLKSNLELPLNFFDWKLDFPEVLNDLINHNPGFDIVIGNPPYIKEDVNRDAFNGLRNLECYQGKMDIWYLFGDLGLKILKPNNHLCYIATNNWVTNAGASKFRNIVIQNTQILNLTDFGGYMIFENASIQTMIMLFKKTKTADNYTFDYRRLEGDKRTWEDMLSLLEKVEKKNLYYLQPQIIKEKLINKTLTFNSYENSILLDKIKAKHNFFIRDKEDKKLNIKTEFGNGIDVMQDFVSKASAEKMNGKAKVGDGVFVLSQVEYDEQKFSAKEKQILKPYYTTKQLNKYYGNPENTHWIIYTRSDINKADKKTQKNRIDSFPKIKAHLDFFQPIITSAFAPYGLNRAREQYIFEGIKILAQRKCPQEPIFTYTEFDCFVSRAFVIIQSDRINLKYLTGLLNSKLVAFWLRKKGKLQGNAYQLDKEPILEIPIYKPTEKDAIELAKLVDKIISLKQQGKDSSVQEMKIDELVYKLYDLSYDEVKVIDPKFPLSQKEYEKISLE